ncbi:tetratricopeptide repeat protein [Marinomonas epiphytica]
MLVAYFVMLTLLIISLGYLYVCHKKRLACEAELPHQARLTPRTLGLWILSVSTLGSVLLYQELGFSKDVVFRQQLVSQTSTPESVTRYLQYRSQRYDSAQDWFYEATNHMSYGKYGQAIQAYQKALEKLPQETTERARVLTEYAQALFYQQGNQSSPALLSLVNEALAIDPSQATAWSLKGVSEFDEQNYLGAVLAWQEAIRYNANSAQRMALLTGIDKARIAGDIDQNLVPKLITEQILVQILWDEQAQWQSDDVLLVYVLGQNSTMPLAIQRVLPSELAMPVMLTNLDNLMSNQSLSSAGPLELVVRRAKLSDQDLTQGQIIARKSPVHVNSRKIFAIKVRL